MYQGVADLLKVMYDFKLHLAAKILNEGKIVSYRSLSRDLNVHCNLAKQILYEFYHQEITKKPGSVHATYLVSGTRFFDGPNPNYGGKDDGDDVYMQSSPFMSSSVPQEDVTTDRLLVTTVTLVREEDLEAIKTRYDHVDSVHIYSLGPSVIQNLQILSDCNRAIAAKQRDSPALESGKNYGVIQNGRAKRRIRHRPNLQTPQLTDIQPRKSADNEVLDSNSDYARSNDRTAVSGKATSQVDLKPTAEPQSLKQSEKKATSKHLVVKREQSDIFKSFSKPKSRLNREDTNSSVEAASTVATEISHEEASVRDQESLKYMSEDEQIEDFAEKPKSDAKVSTTKLEREKQLRQMMEEDDIMENTPEASAPALSIAQEPALIDETKNLSKDLVTECSVETAKARRRGRRKIMKKKTLKDDEGYLVTKEEPAWESFSEDDVPAPPKISAPMLSSSSGGAKGRKSGGKPEKGNIMSFFNQR